MIIGLCGKEGTLLPHHVEALPADSKRRLPDTRKAMNVLGFEAKTSLTTGLQKTIQWYMGQVRR